MHHFTRREKEVLDLIVNEGMGNRQVGNRLGMSERTVKVHVYKMCMKVGAQSRLELAVMMWQDPRYLLGWREDIDSRRRIDVL